MLTELLTSKSRTEGAYFRLRADILACRLKPAELLKINDLCSLLGVSLGAVREALSRLSAEGLVVSQAQKGFQVAPVSVADLDDLTQTRIEIETLCLRQAIAARSIDWETGLVAAFHRLSRTPERVSGDPRRLSDNWAQAHADYHLALVAACESGWLLRLRAMLYVQSERYRRLSVPATDRRRNVNEEHRRIMDAAIAGDAKSACGLLTQHLLLTRNRVRDLAARQKIEGLTEGQPEPNKRMEPSAKPLRSAKRSPRRTAGS
jgi:DNA-binding GntR family transcriptional regulator